jgi:ATP-binding cassette subfamily B protein
LRFRRSRNDDPAGDPAPLSGDRLLVATMQCASRWLAPLVVLEVIGAAATLALPAVLGHALDEIVAVGPGGHGVHGGPTGWFSPGGPLLVTAALVIFVVLCDVVSHLVAGAATAESTGLLRREVVGQMLDVGPTIADSSAGGDLVARLVGNTTTAARSVVVVSGLAATVLPPVGAVVALGLIDPWLALTFAVGMVSASGAVRTYLRDSRAATAGYLEAQGAIATRLIDALAGARSIAAARTTDREVARVLTPLDDVRRYGEVVWRNLARLAFQGEPVVLLTQAAVIGVAGVGVAAGRLTPGEMLAASRYAVMAAGIGGILGELAALARARAGADRIVELLEVPIVRYGRRSLSPGPGALELRGVVASPVIDGLDLVVPGGQVMALVGRSGTGKSLIAALAGRLCDPQQGEVWLDGVPLRQLDRRTLRRAVTYAFERPDLLGESIGDAIGFGAERPSPERIRQAAAAARADQFIVRLPAGYDAALAETPLSGGEIQRLGLARALAHDARLVILDDATSSLDTATEAQIAAALTDEMAGRTRLIVTHRMATAARADLVAWLDGGTVRACAPHRTLWTDPAYRAIFRPDPEQADDPDPAEPATAAVAAPTRAATAQPAASADAQTAAPDVALGEPDPAATPAEPASPAPAAFTTATATAALTGLSGGAAPDVALPAAEHRSALAPGDDPAPSGPAESELAAQAAAPGSALGPRAPAESATTTAAPFDPGPARTLVPAAEREGEPGPTGRSGSAAPDAEPVAVTNPTTNAEPGDAHDPTGPSDSPKLLAELIAACISTANAETGAQHHQARPADEPSVGDGSPQAEPVAATISMADAETDGSHEPTVPSGGLDAAPGGEASPAHEHGPGGAPGSGTVPAADVAAGGGHDPARVGDEPGPWAIPAWVAVATQGPERQGGGEMALRPEPDHEGEDEGSERPGPSGPSGPPVVPTLPTDDEVAASAVAATGLDPMDPTDVLAAWGAL